MPYVWDDASNQVQWINDSDVAAFSAATGQQFGLGSDSQQQQSRSAETPAASSGQPNTVGTGPIDSATGKPVQTQYNQTLFANDADAAALAKQLGGTVMAAPLREGGGGTPGSPYNVPDANYIKMPNGAIVNAGTLLQYQKNYPPAQAQQMIQQEIAGDTPQGLANQGAYGNNYWSQQYGAGSLPTTPANAPGASGAAAGPPPVGATPKAATTTGTGGQTWYQDPTTAQWQYGTPPPGAQTYNGAAPDATTGQLNTGVNPTNPDIPSSPAISQSLKDISLPGGYGNSYSGVNPTPKASPGTAITKDQWGYVNSSDPKTVLANDRGYAYTQGGALIDSYGEGASTQDQRARVLGSAGDDLYAWMLAHPGYTEDQARDIMNQSGLDSLNWTDQMAQDNQLTSDEQSAIKGDPNRAATQYDTAAPGLRQTAQNYGASLRDVYDQGQGSLDASTGSLKGSLGAAIDPTQLGLSDEYKTNYNFGPEDQQAMIEDAGRTVGQGTAAVTDQLQRQSAAAGMNSPLALSAALDRQRQTGAVASADAMTKARIQAKQLGLSTEQQKESTRLGTAQDVSSREMDAAKTVGAADQANQQFLTAGRASSGLQTGAAGLAEENTIAQQQTQLTQAAELQQQQRAQAMAQNRQQVNQSNQSAQFTRGSYQDQAESQRATQEATAARNDQTAARQDVRNEEQNAYNESNSKMAGQLQAFGATTGAGQASQQNAITAAQLPSTLQKIAQGLTGYAEGGIVNEPTMARLGEAGPEIVIKLKPSQPKAMRYQRRNEVQNAA